MKRFLLFVSLLVTTVLSIYADIPFRQARYDGFKVVSPAAGSIIMIGNSITDMHIWQEVFKNADGTYLPICNRGNSGSYSTEQSENLESYIANGPSKVFMMIGTNDLATSGGLNFTKEQLHSYVKSIVDRIHHRSPQTDVYLYPILNNNTGNRVKATWEAYNTLLKEWIETQITAGDTKLHFVDFYDEMSVVANGGSWSNDNLHPNAAAFKIWASKIAPLLGDGVTSVYDEIDGDLTSVQKQDGLSSMNGARATMFSVMPITDNDIMIFGDGEIKTAEWWELLGNANVKNRGTGWSEGGTIDITSKEVDATFAETGADKTGSPKAIFLYTGTDDWSGSTALATVKTNYQALVDKLKEKAPNAKIYMMALHPRNAANERVAGMKAYLDSLSAVEGYENTRVVDCYTPLLDGSVLNTAYSSGNYIYGKGTVIMANAMAKAYNADFATDKMVPVTVDEANTNYAMATRRNQIGTAITAGRDVVAGTEVGEYTEAAVTAFNSAVVDAYNVLAKTEISDDEVTSTVCALTTALSVIAPTKENTVGKYFRLYVPNRGSRYLTNNGVGSTMTGESLGSYDNQVWQLEGRDDGSFDVKSVYDGSYMAMTSPITTTEAKPSAGWTFADCNTAGLFIIKSGTNQLNQQNYSPYNILNWGSGTTKNDDGCNYKIVAVDASDFTHPVVEDGKYYTIAGYVINGSKTTTHYVLYDGTTRSMSTTAPTTNNGVWKAVKNGSTWKFQNMKSKSAMYLTYEGVDATGADYTIEDGVADGCVSMKINGVWSASSEAGDMGGIYKSSSKAVQNSYTWSTDWILTETELMTEGSAYFNFSSSDVTSGETSTAKTVNGVTATVATSYSSGLGSGTSTYSLTDAQITSLNENISNTVFNNSDAQSYISAGAKSSSANLTITLCGLEAKGSYNISLVTGLDKEGAGSWNTITSDNTVVSSTPTMGSQSIAAAALTPYIISGIIADDEGNIVLKVNDTNGSHTAVINALGIYQNEETVDSVTYTINSTNATLYRDGTTATSTAFAMLLKTNATPTVQISTGANNMKWTDGNLTIYPGSGGSCTYTMTAPTGYVFDSYSFLATQSSDNTLTDMTITIGGKTYNTSTAQTISAKRVNENTITIVQTGGNKGIVFSNFTVKIKLDQPEKPTISTDEETVWYYIVNASTSVAYCAGKAMYADADNNYKMRFADKLFNANYIWSFWEDASTHKLAIKNYAGKYIGTAGSGTGNSTQFCAQDAANYIYTINDAYGFFTIKDDAVELHAQSDQQVIVRWAAASDNASLWKFVEVDCSDPEASLTSTTVQQGRVTTGIGNKNLPILRSTLNVTGLTGTTDFKGLNGTITGTGASSVEKVKVYFANNSRELVVDALQGADVTWRDANAEYFGEATLDGTNFSLTSETAKQLAPGTYYVWVTFDISDAATEGETVDATITSYNIGDSEVAESNGNPANAATIFLSEGTVLMPKDKGVDKVNGSTYFRIPAITQVQKNGKTRLVTLTDDRLNHNSDLPSHCYVVGQYSDDLGKTWSEPKIVAGTAETGGDYGHGDASLVTNRDNGEIVGIMTSAGTYGHGFFAGTADQPPLWKTVTSTDGGETWSVPENHTNELFGSGCSNDTTKTWKSGFSGSGAALQKRDGTLVSSFVNRDANNVQNFYFFMSKDGGKHWYRSGNSGTTAADEPKTLERNNGDLAISVRASGYNFHNISSDNGLTWKNASQTRFTSGISGNACDGEYMVWCSSLEGNQVADGVGDIAFQTLPNSGSRQNVSIALSTDEGETFGSAKTICPCGSAYSAAVVLPDGTLGVYYEENGIFGGYTMRFVRFSLDWASNGAYKFTEEHPFVPIASIRCDANGDGSVDVNDVKKIIHQVKTATEIEHKTSVDTRVPDLNYDGRITVTDADILIDKLK